MFKNIQIHQIVIALLLGVAIGAWGIQMRDYGCWMGAPHKGAIRQHMIKKMEKELSLSAEQKQKLEAIFETTRPRMKALRLEMRPKFEELRKETSEQVRAILTPEQLPKFEELNQKMEELWKKRHEKRDNQ